MNELFAKARRHLARRDPVMKALIRFVGPCTLQHDPNQFAVLVRSIVAQQISTKAAHAISGRLSAALKERVEPRRILRASEESLRAVGLSQGKMLALRDLAAKCISGEVPLAHLDALEDEAIVEALVQVRGIGRWTAEMFLIFSLGRLDILPVGDYGLRAGVLKHYGLAELPGKAVLAELAAPWQPYRSIATWYLWRSAGFVPQSDAGAGPA